MNVLTIKAIRHDGKVIDPGSTIEAPNKETLKHWIESESAIPVDEPKDVSGNEIPELAVELEIESNVANLLIENGFDTVDKVGEATKEQLTAIKGIGNKTADTILGKFTPAE